MRIVAGYSSSSSDLTPRMLEALAGRARGETAKATAARLGVSEATIKTVLAAARVRLDVPSTAAAIAVAAKDGRL